jgi:hypothetical protein
MQQGKKRYMPPYHSVSLTHVTEIDVMDNAEIITGRHSVIETTEF